jgi:hypothetical protein
MLRDVSFSGGSTFGVETRPQSAPAPQPFATFDLDASSFSDPEMLNLMDQFERREEEKRRLARKEALARALHDEELAKAAQDEELAKAAENEGIAMANQMEQQAVVTKTHSSIIAESEPCNRALSVAPTAIQIGHKVAHSAQTGDRPFSRLTHLSMVFGNDSHVESVLAKLFGK